MKAFKIYASYTLQSQEDFSSLNEFIYREVSRFLFDLINFLRLFSSKFCTFARVLRAGLGEMASIAYKTYNGIQFFLLLTLPY